MAISQQALSKRVARLEEALGVALFDRGGAGRGGLRLTRAGERFQGPARQALAAGDAAVEAAHGTAGPLRIDTWGHLYGPGRTLGPLLEAVAGLTAETGAGRGPASVAAALLHGDADAGFGWIDTPGNGPEAGLSHGPVRYEPMDLLVSEDHPLAGRTEVSPAELSGGILWSPAALDRLDFLRHFADTFAVTARRSGTNLGLPNFLTRLRADPGVFSLFPADHPLPAGSGLRSVPLTGPTPLYAWSLLWPASRPHPRLNDLLRELPAVAAEHRWLEYTPGRDWLPGTDGT